MVSTPWAAYGPPYLHPRWRRCFYCGALLVPCGCYPPGARLPDNVATIDHVYPRRLRPRSPASEWYRLNRVAACSRCNCLKGDRHPALWLAAVVPNRRGAFVDRLAKLDTLAAVAMVAV